MRFTQQQYDEAMQSLHDAREQLEPDGKPCACCGDSGHQAFECGHNPLVAMALCEQIAKQSYDLHETLHLIAGMEFHMGVQLGPAKVQLPSTS